MTGAVLRLIGVTQQYGVVLGDGRIVDETRRDGSESLLEGAR